MRVHACFGGDVLFNQRCQCLLLLLYCTRQSVCPLLESSHVPYTERAGGAGRLLQAGRGRRSWSAAGPRCWPPASTTGVGGGWGACTLATYLMQHCGRAEAPSCRPAAGCPAAAPGCPPSRPAAASNAAPLPPPLPPKRRRHLARHPGLCQPGKALAPGPAGGSHRRRRQVPGAAPAIVPALPAGPAGQVAGRQRGRGGRRRGSQAPGGQQRPGARLGLVPWAAGGAAGGAAGRGGGRGRGRGRCCSRWRQQLAVCCAA
jgi:hypothetical protein